MPIKRRVSTQERTVLSHFGYSVNNDNEEVMICLRAGILHYFTLKIH